MVYELRHYDIEEDNGLRFVVRRFEEHVLPAFERSGITPIGFWTVFAGANQPRLTYLLPWTDLGERQSQWGQFEADSEWRRVLAESNSSYGGSPIRTITNTILQLIPNSPVPTPDNQPSHLSGTVFELRTLHFRDYGSLAKYVRWFDERMKPMMDSHSMFLMGAWTTVIGITPRLTMMFSFESLADRESAWSALQSDPRWLAAEATSDEGGKPWVIRTDSCLMRGAGLGGWS